MSEASDKYYFYSFNHPWLLFNNFSCGVTKNIHPTVLQTQWYADGSDDVIVAWSEITAAQYEAVDFKRKAVK